MQTKACTHIYFEQYSLDSLSLSRPSDMSTDRLGTILQIQIQENISNIIHKLYSCTKWKMGKNKNLNKIRNLKNNI